MCNNTLEDKGFGCFNSILSIIVKILTFRKINKLCIIKINSNTNDR